MLAYSVASEEFSHAAYLLGQAAATLDRIAKKDPAAWRLFENRMNDALDIIAVECEAASVKALDLEDRSGPLVEAFAE
jgi:hypothetical protein